METKFAIVNESQDFEKLISMLGMYTLTPTTRELCKYIKDTDMFEGDMVVTFCI